jgi:thiamine-phosphate pyrophosphorylase
MRVDGPIVCLVTDRGRLVGPEGGVAAARARLTDVARAAVGAGVDLIQVRERDLETAELVDLVHEIVEIARAGVTRVVVNDRLDVALACGAAGVHLRADSYPPRVVRAMMPEPFLIGRSVHGVDEARAHAAAVDYFIAGTVFPSESKPAGTQWLGVGGLEAIVQSVRVPVLAIGGIGVDQVAAVAAAGAAGIAAIGLFLPNVVPLAGILDAVGAQFDSGRAAF